MRFKHSCENSASISVETGHFPFDVRSGGNLHYRNNLSHCEGGELSRNHF